MIVLLKSQRMKNWKSTESFCRSNSFYISRYNFYNFLELHLTLSEKRFRRKFSFSNGFTQNPYPPFNGQWPKSAKRDTNDWFPFWHVYCSHIYFFSARLLSMCKPRTTFHLPWRTGPHGLTFHGSGLECLPRWLGMVNAGWLVPSNQGFSC